MSESGAFHPPEEAGEPLAEDLGQGAFLENYSGREDPGASPAADEESTVFRQT